MSTPEIGDTAKKKKGYAPPFTITSKAIRLISEISETLGGFSVANQFDIAPKMMSEYTD
jgi:hypothetical protein